MLPSSANALAVAPNAAMATATRVLRVQNSLRDMCAPCEWVDGSLRASDVHVRRRFAALRFERPGGLPNLVACRGIAYLVKPKLASAYSRWNNAARFGRGGEAIAPAANIHLPAPLDHVCIAAAPSRARPG